MLASTSKNEASRSTATSGSARVTVPAGWIAASCLAAALSLAFLGLSLMPSLRPLLAEASASYALRAVVGSESLATPVLLDLLRFMAACLLLHGCIGVAALGMTRVSEVARVTSSSQRLGVVFLWFTGISVSLVLWSADALPQSHSAATYGRIAGYGVGQATFAQIWTSGVLLSALVILIAAIWRTRLRLARPRTAVLMAGSLAIAALSVAGQGTVGARASGAETVRPHVIIVGIDSLRPDTLAEMMAAGRLPNMSRLVSRSAWFPDTITPLARTFPAWISILTGKGPSDCAAVCNLVPRGEVTLGPTLATALSDHGYHSVLATDEVRFSNIDESYGFDQVVTPAIGASEFLIGWISDLPALNAVANSFIASIMFPQIYGNRAVAHVYRPSTFLSMLRQNVRFERQTFMAVHLTMPHWPYVTADSPASSHPGGGWDERYQDYLGMVESVDRQVGSVLGWLQEQGVMNNAIVVLLSDHGEALNRPGDSILEDIEDPVLAPFSVPVTGHGSSVLSASQFQVVLGFSGHGDASKKVQPGPRYAPATLEDVTPTVLEMLGIESAEEYAGLSLYSSVRGEPAGTRIMGRTRFTETGFNTPRLLAGDFNADWIAMQAAEYYRVNPSTGYLELRPSSIPLVNAMKERAAIKGDQLLAALPNASGGQTLLLVDRVGARARIVDPADGDQDVAAMREALDARFGLFVAKGDRPSVVARQ